MLWIHYKHNLCFNECIRVMRMFGLYEECLALKRAFGWFPAVSRSPGLLLGGLLGLLGQQHSLDVGQHAALSDGHSAQQLVELLVVADSQLQVTGDDPGLLVVAGSVSSQLQDLSGQVLQHSRQIDGGSGTDTLSIVAFTQMPVNTTDGELEPGPGGAGLCLSAGFASGFSSTTHFWILLESDLKENVIQPVKTLLYMS